MPRKITPCRWLVADHESPELKYLLLFFLLTNQSMDHLGERLNHASSSRRVDSGDINHAYNQTRPIINYRY
uniref:Uncharacterized protein n=1 Tax=Nelumbo nucifera TaxID=4432 RepID=A0A822YVL1_NELNU|nr:TPA_asm: hypothetical protein HUJ06_006241 [Nelumbo nucifera]